MREVQHLINGKMVDGASGNFADIYNPNTGDVQAKVALASQDEMAIAIEAAETAFPKVQRGLEVVEFACGMPHVQKGEYTGAAGPGIDVYSLRQPLGVCAGITPFNFPAMIPMWMFAMAISAGNTFILKPSEKDPSVPMRLGELFLEAGAPEGVLNVVNGDKVAVDAILDHSSVKAVSFVGSSDIAQYIYARGTANGKRVQAMGGAKNHGIILPDANMDQAVNDITGAAFGSAGERCMALPVVVPVGKKTADEFLERITDAAKNLKVGISTDTDAHYGPVVSAAHKAKVEDYIRIADEEDGADMVLDGRGLQIQGYENGYFIGPTIFDNVSGRSCCASKQSPIRKRRCDLHT